MRYNATVKNVAYSGSGVEVTLVDGTVLTADYALYVTSIIPMRTRLIPYIFPYRCTFSLGVLQNDDVTFLPALPEWKQEAIQSMTMVIRPFCFSSDVSTHHTYVEILGHIH